MVDLNDLLGSLLKRGLTPSTKTRVDKSLNDNTLSDILEEQFGAARQSSPPPAEAAPQSPRSTPASVPTRQSGPSWDSTSANPRTQPPAADTQNPRAGGGLGDLGGMFGKSFKQAIGAGALALLASVAMKALRGSSKKAAALPEAPQFLKQGLTSTSGPQYQQTQSLADLLIRAMVNATKADGQIDDDEVQRIVGQFGGEGLTADQKEYLTNELRRPPSTAEIVKAVPDLQTAAQVYAGSLLAIEVDTPAEREYLKQFARDLRLDPQVVAQIHGTLGVA